MRLIHGNEKFSVISFKAGEEIKVYGSLNESVKPLLKTCSRSAVTQLTLLQDSIAAVTDPEPGINFCRDVLFVRKTVERLGADIKPARLYGDPNLARALDFLGLQKIRPTGGLDVALSVAYGNEVVVPKDAARKEGWIVRHCKVDYYKKQLPNNGKPGVLWLVRRSGDPREERNFRVFHKEPEFTPGDSVYKVRFSPSAVVLEVYKINRRGKWIAIDSFPLGSGKFPNSDLIIKKGVILPKRIVRVGRRKKKASQKKKLVTAA